MTSQPTDKKKGFTAKCVIHRSTPKLWRCLAGLGLHQDVLGPKPEWGEDKCLVVDNGIYFTSRGEIDLGNFFDCGKNGELFLSVAAMRDDCDSFQWFMYDGRWRKEGDGKDYFWFKCVAPDVADELAGGLDIDSCYKARPQEIRAYLNGYYNDIIKEYTDKRINNTTKI